MLTRRIEILKKLSINFLKIDSWIEDADPVNTLTEEIAANSLLNNRKYTWIPSRIPQS